MSRGSRSKRAALAELAELDGCGRHELIARWLDIVGKAPPAHTSSTFLRDAIAYELQTKALGKLLKRVEQVLTNALKEGFETNPQLSKHNDAVAVSGDIFILVLADRPSPQSDGKIDDTGKGRSMSSRSVQSVSPPQLTPKLALGTQLVREWNGRTWQVEVIDGGFVCKGKRYRSLSSIAKMITGAHWCGPRFFGLRS